MRVFVDDSATQDDVAGGGEFDGVAGVIEQRLLQAGDVAFKPAGGGVEFAVQRQAAIAGTFAEHRDDVGDHAVDAQRTFVENELAGLDLGQIENVVEDVEQVVAGGGYLVEFERLLGILAAFSQ